MRIIPREWLSLSVDQRLRILTLAAYMPKSVRFEKMRKPAKVGDGELSKKIIWISSKCTRSAHLEQRGGELV